jgi:hypothetical protein
MDSQSVIVLVIILAAVFYVGRALLPTRKGRPTCSSCPQNRARADDYV